MNEVPKILKDKRALYYCIPYVDILARIFPITSSKAHRDFKKLLSLIGSIAMLHAYQRPIVYQKGKLSKHYVLALPIDLYLALRVCDKSMKQTLLALQDRMILCLALFKQTDMILTARMVGEALNLSESRARQILNVLCKVGYLMKDERQKTHRYSLNMEPPELIAVCDLANLSRSFGKKELDSYVEANNFILLQRAPPFPTTAVDPLTGETKDCEGMLADLMSRPSRRKARAPVSDMRGEGDKQELKRIPEKLEDFKGNSPTDMSAPEKEEGKTCTTLPLSVLEKLKKILPSADKPFTRDEFLAALRSMGWNPYASGVVLEILENEGVIHATDIDKGKYNWAR